MNLIEHTKQELDIIGMSEDSNDVMKVAMRNHILHMVEEFSKEGHSGFSAAYALNILEKVLAFETLSPLIGEDSEWNDVYYMGVKPKYQNKCCSRVFKDKNGECYDVQGKVFTEHYFDEEGVEQTSSFTGKDSHVVVTFPYTPKTEYVDVGVRKQ